MKVNEPIAAATGLFFSILAIWLFGVAGIVTVHSG